MLESHVASAAKFMKHRLAGTPEGTTPGRIGQPQRRHSANGDAFAKKRPAPPPMIPTNTGTTTQTRQQNCRGGKQITRTNRNCHHMQSTSLRSGSTPYKAHFSL